jgi:hypothetical protein
MSALKPLFVLLLALLFSGLVSAACEIVSFDVNLETNTTILIDQNVPLKLTVKSPCLTNIQITEASTIIYDGNFDSNTLIVYWQPHTKGAKTISAVSDTNSVSLTPLVRSAKDNLTLLFASSTNYPSPLENNDFNIAVIVANNSPSIDYNLIDLFFDTNNQDLNLVGSLNKVSKINLGVVSAFLDWKESNYIDTNTQVVVWIGFGSDKVEITRNVSTENASCGDATLTYSYSAPTTNLCALGTPSAITFSLTRFYWTCSPLLGVHSAACESHKIPFDGGDGNTNNPFLISTIEQLQAVNEYLSYNFLITNDINAQVTSTWNNGQGFVSLGTYPEFFKGTIDGNNFTISNLFIDSNTSLALFGNTAQSAKISNIVLADFNISGGDGSAGLVGYNYGDVNNAHARGTVDCMNGVNMLQAGILVGYNSGSISYSSAEGDVNCRANVGGIAGVNISDENSPTAVIFRSHSDANVRGFGSTGGLVGVNFSANVSESYSTGNVYGLEGALDIWEFSIATGGLIGELEPNSVISDSYSTANVWGGQDVGGLIGLVNGNSMPNPIVGVVKNSYSTGDVNGGWMVGGLIGVNDGNVWDSFSIGYLDINDYMSIVSGGLVGYQNYSNTGTLRNNFWDLNSSNHPYCDNYFFPTPAQGCTPVNDSNSDPLYFYSQLNAPLNSWDFVSVWANCDGNTLPWLRWENRIC